MKHAFPRRLSAIVFDCGDTLLELVPGKVEICGRVLEELGHGAAPERIRLAYRIADAQLKQRSSLVDTPEKKRAFFTQFNDLLACALGLESLASAFDRALQAAFGTERHWTLVDGARETLAGLDGRLPLFVLANWDTRLHDLLTRNRIDHCFQAAFASQELGAEKPDAAIFEAFAQRTGVVAAEALYVGNEYLADVVGSRRAGFTPLLLDREGFHGSEVDCLRFQSWQELWAALDESGALPDGPRRKSVAKQVGTPHSPADLEGSWILVALDGEPLAAAGEPAPDLTISPDGTFAGFAGVNRFGGTLEQSALSAGRFGSGPLRSTRMAGPPAAMELEGRYLGALEEADGWTLSEGALLLTRAGIPLARFTRTP